MALNITTAVIGSGCNAATASPSLAQWDRGQILQISGVELPETYKVEFSNGDTLEAIPAIGTAEGVEIPDKLLYSSSPIRAYIVLSEAEGERNTEYWVTIYVKPREIPEDIEPDPAQQDVIDDLIAQLNTGVGKAEDAADAAEASAGEAEAASQAVQDLGVRAETAASGAPAAVQKIVDAETGAVTLVFSLPQGEAGFSPVVTVTTITGGHRVTVTDSEGAHSFDVMDGEDGRSVTGVTMGADYKLTFTFSDGTTWTTPTSIRGETGATPRLTIGTVSTLDPGQSATAEITGTPEDPVLNLGIPKGQAGASDAGAVTYNPETAYNDGTVGKAVSDLSRQLSDLEDTVSTTQIINTASGAIASFADGADGQPIRKLVANIEPVQDLHGYDSPWPAGGGVNKANLAGATSLAAYNLTTSFDTENEIITISGTVTTTVNNYVQYRFAVFPNIQNGLGLKAFNIPASASVYVENLFWDGSTQRMIVVIRGLTIGETNTLNVKFQMVAYEGDTAPTAWTPYSNICPISGYTGAEIEQRGKNLLPKAESKTHNGIQYVANSDGSVTVSGTATGIAILDIGRDSTILKPGTYVASISGSNAVVTLFKIVDGTVSVLKNGVGAFTLTEETSIFMRLSFASGASASGTAYPQIELGSTATAYEPYTGNQISVNWEDEAGTVYGGTLDVTNGVLTVNRAHRLLNDPDKWIEMSSGTQNFRYNYQFSERKRYADSFTGLSCSYMQVNANAQDNTARWSGVGTDYFGLRNYKLHLFCKKVHSSYQSISGKY